MNYTRVPAKQNFLLHERSCRTKYIYIYTVLRCFTPQFTYNNYIHHYSPSIWGIGIKYVHLLQKKMVSSQTLSITHILLYSHRFWLSTHILVLKVKQAKEHCRKDNNKRLQKGITKFMTYTISKNSLS